MTQDWLDDASQDLLNSGAEFAIVQRVWKQTKWEYGVRFNTPDMAALRDLISMLTSTADTLEANGLSDSPETPESIR